jgi:predicted dithiol-disulfide oxidoreductase (DUF899 family)
MLLATCNQARGRRIQDAQCAFNLCHQRGNTSVVCGSFSPSKRGTGLFCTQPPHRDSRNHQLVKGPRRGREDTGIEVGEPVLRLVQLPDQKKPPNFKITCKASIQTIAVSFEHRSSGIEHFRGPAEVAGGERDFRQGDRASRARHGFFRPKCARCIPQEFLRPHEVSKLRHRDATERERRRIIPQRYALQRSQCIASRKSARCSCNQKIHRNPDTLVTPTSPMPHGKYSACNRTPSHIRVEEKETTMKAHKIGTQEEWLKARLDLLKAEKELTRHSDEVARQRQELPWVPLNKGYRFDTEEGGASLADLFRGHSQLLIYHFMFGPDFAAGCPSCSSIANGLNGIVADLAKHDVMLWAVSRAPLAKLQDYKRRMGWSFPWASSFGSDFNFDFHVSFTGEQLRDGAEYNFRRDDPVMNIGQAGDPGSGPAKMATIAGTDVGTYTREREGMSAFLLQDGIIYHTYSTYARGVDAIWGKYAWLDRAPKGRARQVSAAVVPTATDGGR